MQKKLSYISIFILLTIFVTGQYIGTHQAYADDDDHYKKHSREYHDDDDHDHDDDDDHYHDHDHDEYYGRNNSKKYIGFDKGNMHRHIENLQKEWAYIKYQLSDEKQQIRGFKRLSRYAQKVSKSYEYNSEPKIWQGIILSTLAGVDGGFGALNMVNKAKALFEQAIEQNANALDGAAYTSLGALYYQVPSWPISFGSNKKAREYLEKSLQLNPDGIDSNYFYADFLLQDGKKDEARKYFEKALRAPVRPNRPLADEGRRGEINTALSEMS